MHRYDTMSLYRSAGDPYINNLIIFDWNYSSKVYLYTSCQLMEFLFFLVHHDYLIFLKIKALLLLQLLLLHYYYYYPAPNEACPNVV